MWFQKQENVAELTKEDARHFINWLETMPKDERFGFLEGHLLEQYLTACGLENAETSAHTFYCGPGDKCGQIPYELEKIAKLGLIRKQSTFGVALKYAKNMFDEMFPEGY